MNRKSAETSMQWRSWQPGLMLTDHRKLGAVYRDLPGEKPKDVPGIVRFYENPESPYAFPGAIHLHRHDIMHILLGRGLRNQDEAFVIGFTMGAASHIKEYHAQEYQRLASTLYPRGYKWQKPELIAYRLSFDYARANTDIKRDVHRLQFETRMNRSITDIRTEIGIEVADLWVLYQCEKLLIPRSAASTRLRIHQSPPRCGLMKRADGYGPKRR
jgi:hypothetical protein